MNKYQEKEGRKTYTKKERNTQQQKDRGRRNTYQPIKKEGRTTKRKK